MSVGTSRLGARIQVAGAIALWLVVGVAAPAAATPVTLFFDGPSGFGVSAESADDAFALGVPFVYPDFVGSASGVLEVISQDLQLGSIASLGESGISATSIWQVGNESSVDLLGDTYFLFVTTVPFSIEGEVVEYDDAGIGLTIDPDDGWVLVRTSTESGEGYYYPAVSLGSLAAGETAAPFAVNYVIDQPIQLVATTSVLPQVASGMGFTPIPEPGAGLLMGLGLVLLAAARRQRS